MSFIGLDNGVSHIAAGGHGWILYGRIVSRRHLEVFAAAREGPLEIDFWRIGVDAAGYGHRLLQGGANNANRAAAANGRICARQECICVYYMYVCVCEQEASKMQNNEQLHCL